MTIDAASSPPRNWRRLALLLLGWGLGLALLYIALARFAVETDNLAFGTETQSILGTVDGRVAHCLGADDSAYCVAEWRKAGEPDTILWMGNSQLPAINRMAPGDENAPQLLFRALEPRGKWLVTYSEPNANLSEQALVYEAISPIYDPKLVILPVCYDDIREQGIRDIVLDFTADATVRRRIESAKTAPFILPYMTRTDADASNPDAAAADPTPQSRVEAAVTRFLDQHWGLWAQRPMLRGNLGGATHLLRNKILGIHSTTKRAVSPVLYAERMALLDVWLTEMRRDGRDVLLYIPPYRRDIDGPYVEADYQAFRRDLQQMAAKHGAHFADLEPVVPGAEWATVTDTIFGFKEPDFMHFTAEGHQKFAAAIEKSIRAMGY